MTMVRKIKVIMKLIKYKIISKIQKEGNNPSDRENVSGNDGKCFT